MAGAAWGYPATMSDREHEPDQSGESEEQDDALARSTAPLGDYAERSTRERVPVTGKDAAVETEVGVDGDGSGDGRSPEPPD